MLRLSHLNLNKNELQNAVIQPLGSAPSSPVEGQIYYNTTDDTVYVRANGAWLDLGVQGGAGATDLSQTLAATTVTINSNTGADTTIAAADGTNAGVMTSAMSTKLAGIAANATANDTDANLKNRSNHTGTQLASTISDFQTTVSANTDVAANTTARHTHSNSAVLNATTASFLTADETKLDGIEAGADVTDAANVDAAGAVMNSDTTTASMSFVVDEDNMVSNSATKVPTQQSTKAYVDTAVAGIVNAAPAALDTLDELAAALGDDANFATTTATNIGLKLAKASNLSDVASAATSFSNIKQAATTTATGVVELATDAEAIAKASTAVVVTPSNLASFTRKYTATIGDGSTTAIAVTDSLGTIDKVASIRDATTNAEVECDITYSSTQTTFTFATAPASNAYKVTIVG